MLSEFEPKDGFDDSHAILCSLCVMMIFTEVHKHELYILQQFAILASEHHYHQCINCFLGIAAPRLLKPLAVCTGRDFPGLLNSFFKSEYKKGVCMAICMVKMISV